MGGILPHSCSPLPYLPYRNKHSRYIKELETDPKKAESELIQDPSPGATATLAHRRALTPLPTDEHTHCARCIYTYI